MIDSLEDVEGLKLDHLSKGSQVRGILLAFGGLEGNNIALLKNLEDGIPHGRLIEEVVDLRHDCGSSCVKSYSQ